VRNVKSTWSVVVVFENADARETAVSFCDSLVKRFWTRCGFDVAWWSYDLLNDSAPAESAASKASEADIVIIATSSEEELPLSVKKWGDMWLGRRGEREGSLVGLSQSKGSCPLSHSYLRGLAHRAGMDFLTEVPCSIPDAASESTEFFSQRAHQVTSVLDAILHQPAPPPHL
jgi:hypothetical protein